MARTSHHLIAALAELREELGEIEAHADKVRAAIISIEQLIAAETDEPSPVPELAVVPPISNDPSPWVEFELSRPQQPENVNGGTPPPRRPLLRDGIPSVLRDYQSGLVIKALANELLAREWIGGATEDSRVEMVRGELRELKRKGVVTSEIPRGQKAAIWRLSNVLLSQPPAYSQPEGERSI